MEQFVFEVSAEESGQRIDKALAKRLDEAIETGFSRKKTKKLLDANEVRRNGRVERIASRRLQVGDKVQVRVNPDVVGSPKSHKKFNLSPDEILWEDEFVIAIDKPSGLPSQKTRDPRRDHAVAAVRRYLKWRGDDDPYVALHHRLDVGTSGVLLFARDRRANKGLADAFQQRTIRKTYRAVSRSTEQSQRRDEGDRWAVDNHLASSTSGGGGRQQAVQSGGDFARTEFEICERTGSVHHIVARPQTGRRHQIRVHLADEGLPIVGDERYGGAAQWDGKEVERMMLHAQRLVLSHPVRDSVIDITSPVPHEFQVRGADL